MKKSDECRKHKDDEVIKAYKGDNKDIQKMIEGINNILNSPIHMAGITGTIGQKEFKYLKEDSLEKTSSDEQPVSMSAYYTFVLPRRIMATFEYEHQKAFKANPDTTRCPATPSNNSSFLTCVTGADGHPDRVTNRNWSVGLRFPFWKIATAPKAIYNSENHEWSTQIPIYIFEDGKNNFTGGFRGDWGSEEHSWAFSIFVGSKFKVF